MYLFVGAARAAHSPSFIPNLFSLQHQTCKKMRACNMLTFLARWTVVLPA